MSQITKIEMWKDTGFQEGAIEVPSVNDILPELASSTDNYTKITYEGGIRTSTADFFSGFTIPEFFTDDILGFSYIRIHYSYNSGTDMTFYGWIDDISLKSDTADNPSIHISWHIDYWRTYLGSAKLGYGMIQSRPTGTDDPPQSCSYRFRTAKNFHSLLPSVTGSDVNWLIFTYVKEEDDGKVTNIRTCVVPIDKNNLDTNYKVRIGSKEYSTPSLAEIAGGTFLTNLGISANQITSAFISPIPPVAIDKKEGDVYYPKTTSTETTEYITDDFDDEKVRRCTESRIGYVTSTRNYSLTFYYSDGTIDARSNVKEADVKGILDSVNGVSNWTGASQSQLIVNIGSAYKVSLAELISQNYPSQAFLDGDRITIPNVATSRTTSFRADTSAKKYYYDVTQTQADQTFTFTNGSWPDVTIYADHRISGTLRYQRISSQYSVDVESAVAGKQGYVFTKSQAYYEYEVNMNGIMTTDTSELVVTDMTGSPVATAPWGMPLRKGTVRAVISTVSAYLQYRFDGYNSAAEGLSFTIPLQPVDIASNSWVDYVYSGARDYDISQRKISSQQALVGSITSSLTGATSNAVMGSIGGVDQSHWENWVASFVSGGANGASLADTRGALTSMYAKSPNAVRALGALDQAYSNALYGATPPAVSFGGGKAFGASMAVGVASAAIEYATTQYFNGQLQKAEDMLQAKQFDNITLPGGGWDWLWHGREIGIVAMEGDEYSLTRFSDDKRLNGIYCSEPTEDCDYIRTSEGPYRISELIVTGSIPVQARAHIKGRFANGVRIRTINTETVTEGD